jgi:hypothetical protein
MLPLGPHDRSTSPNRERGPTIVGISSVG